MKLLLTKSDPLHDTDSEFDIHSGTYQAAYNSAPDSDRQPNLASGHTLISQSEQIDEANLITRPEGSNDSDAEAEGKEDEELRGATFERKQIRIDQIRDQYASWFTFLSQKGCKKVLQFWIKRGHPRKQAENPYNGKGDGDKTVVVWDKDNPGACTAPHYWPCQTDYLNVKSGSARHREPDHIKKHGT